MSAVDVDFPFGTAATGRTRLTGTEDHVRDMIEQVLFTRPGERVVRPDFGCGLLDLVFEPNGPDLAAALQVTVQTALHRWLGDVIAVRSLSVTAEDAVLRIEIGYELLATGAVRTEAFDSGVIR
ncbi:baseplate protein [Streptomyces lavendulae subsp. lavendulae]|nr:phage baseplate assembly protein W [Streptomyces sp. SPB4]GLV84534.1 baseplate protein [Streptomyces lavendulae subsp. lavendulae]